LVKAGGKGGVGGTVQMLEQFPTRGFQSSVDPRLHFGLGSSTRIDSLIVVWPDRRTQVLTDVAVDRPLTLSQRDALRAGVGAAATAGGRLPAGAAAPTPATFTDVTDRLGIRSEERRVGKGRRVCRG